MEFQNKPQHPKISNAVNQEYEERPDPHNVKHIFPEVLHKNIPPDVEVVAGGQVIKCHRSVLASFSPVLKRQLYSSNWEPVKKAINLPDICKEDFEVLLNYMYTGHLKINCNNYLEIYQAASDLKMHDVVRICLKLVDGGDEIRSFYYIYVTSKKLGAEEYRARSLGHLTYRFEESVCAEELLQLDVDSLVDILSADTIGARSETIVFLAALNWLDADFPRRRKHAIRVMQCVRFSAMTLDEINACHHPPFLYELLAIPEIVTLLYRAKCYIKAKLFGQEYKFQNYACKKRNLAFEHLPMELWHLTDSSGTFNNLEEEQEKAFQRLASKESIGFENVTNQNDTENYTFPKHPHAGPVLSSSSNSIESELSELDDRQEPEVKFPPKKKQSLSHPKQPFFQKFNEEFPAQFEDGPGSLPNQPKPRKGIGAWFFNREKPPNELPSPKESSGRSGPFEEPAEHPPKNFASYNDTFGEERRFQERTEPRPIFKLPSKPHTLEEDRPYEKYPEPEYKQEKPEYRQEKPEYRQEKPEYKQEKPEYKQDKPEYPHPGGGARAPEFRLITYKHPKDPEDLDLPFMDNGIDKRFRTKQPTDEERRLTFLQNDDYEERASEKNFRRGKNNNSFALCKKKRSTGIDASPDFLSQKKHQTPYILLVGGLNPKSLQTAGIGGAVLNYVPNKNKWLRYSTIPQARCNHCVAYYNDQLYVIGGCDPKETVNQMPHRAKNTCFRLHTRTLEWEEIEPMSYRRYDHAVAILDRYIFVIGGQDDGERLLKNMEVYDTKKDVWKQLSTEMCCGRKAMGAIGFKRKVWIAGGLIQLDNDTNFQIVSHVDCYDPKIKKWFYCINLLPSPRLYNNLTEWNGVICCVGGMTQTSVKDTRLTDDVLFLDDTARVWSAGPSLPVPRLGAGVVVFENILYVVGGFNPEAELHTKNVYYLTKTADTWEVAAPLPAQLYGCSVVSIP